jgi:hypothetical protein
LHKLPRLRRHTSRPALSRRWTGLAHCCAALVKLTADLAAYPVPNGGWFLPITIERP